MAGKPIAGAIPHCAAVAYGLGYSGAHLDADAYSGTDADAHDYF